MFNGIIYNQGTIVKILKKRSGINIFLKSNIKISKKNIGISIHKLYSTSFGEYFGGILGVKKYLFHRLCHPNLFPWLRWREVF